MNEFIVRVELHKAPERYEELHKLMHAKKLYRVLLEGKTYYRLPPAEYWHHTTRTAAQVLQLVVDIVNAMKPPIPPGADTGPDVKGTCAIMVTEAVLPVLHLGLKKFVPKKKSPAK